MKAIILGMRRDEGKTLITFKKDEELIELFFELVNRFKFDFHEEVYFDGKTPLKEIMLELQDHIVSFVKAFSNIDVIFGLRKVFFIINAKESIAEQYIEFISSKADWVIKK